MSDSRLRFRTRAKSLSLRNLFETPLRRLVRSTNATICRIRVRVGPPVRWTLSATRGSIRHKRIQRAMYGEPLTIATPEGLTLSGLLYPGDGTTGPGVLMLHGWDPLGQRHGYYVALAQKLRSIGHTVLTFNYCGYPGSATPSSSEGFNLAGLVRDVRAALSALLETGLVGAGGLTLFGHSYGGCLVLPTIMADDRIDRAVIHGPSIWIGHRITGREARERDFYHERY